MVQGTHLRGKLLVEVALKPLHFMGWEAITKPPADVAITQLRPPRPQCPDAELRGDTLLPGPDSSPAGQAHPCKLLQGGLQCRAAHHWPV